MSKTFYEQVNFARAPQNGAVTMGYSLKSGNMAAAWTDDDKPGWMFMTLKSGRTIRSPLANVNGCYAAEDNAGQPAALLAADAAPSPADIDAIRAKRDKALAAKREAEQPKPAAKRGGRRKAAPVEEPSDGGGEAA